MNAIREGPAKFYDLNPHFPNDIPFYLDRLRTPPARVLELGCGTGRVSLPLAQRCAFLHGLDRSQAMLAICRSKLDAAGWGEERVRVERADICAFHLDATFDLIIAPFRVFQHLARDAQLAGLFDCIRRHLAADGRCILTAFNPSRSPEAMRREWVSDHEHLEWEVQTADGWVACYAIRPRIDPDRLILYPELIYRRFDAAGLVEEAVLKLAMRCHYPADLLSRIEAEGFRVVGKWGGYRGEDYGRGSELVVEFTLQA